MQFERPFGGPSVEIVKCLEIYNGKSRGNNRRAVYWRLETLAVVKGKACPHVVHVVPPLLR